ncbi:MAG TPA: GMP synthase, partial [Thermoplasmatales archaeon]|nr:GMP synthase [Thermoplasmatales archaeon]HEX17114.1 GMP synthase [Thermoplasmatales archaeon]
EAMAHRKRPIIGLQFHPEVEHTEYGMQIFKNFIGICEENR